MRPTFAALLCLLGLALPAADALAQSCEPEPSPRAAVRRVARRHYAEGVRESQAGRWEAARDAFQQAYETAAFSPVMYNLASSLEQTGQLVEASEMFRALLRRCEAEEGSQLRGDAEALLAEIEARIAHATIRVGDFDPGLDAVTLDGEALVDAVIGEELPLDPGRHRVEVARDGEDAVATEFTLAAGERATIDLRPAEAAVGDPDGGGSSAPPSTAPASSGFDATPAWIVFGASLAVAAGGAGMLAFGVIDLDEVNNSPEGTPITDVTGRAETAIALRNTGAILLGVGVAGAVGGLLWAVLGGGDEGDDTTVRVGPTSIEVAGRF